MRQSLLNNQRPAIDEGWFEALTKLTNGSMPIYELLEPAPTRLEKLKTAFYRTGRTIAPDLRPHVANTEMFRKNHEGLQTLRSRIENEEPNQHIRNAYCGHLDERIGELTLLLAADDSDGDGFRAANEALYGTPKEAIFAAVCNWLRSDAQKYQTHADASIVSASEAVLRAVPNLHGDQSILLPDATTFQNVWQHHSKPGGYFDSLFANTNIPTDQPITQEHGDNIVRQVLKNIESAYTLTDSLNQLWGVLHPLQTIVRPAGYSLSREEFMGIISHEVGSHLMNLPKLTLGVSPVSE